MVGCCCSNDNNDSETLNAVIYYARNGDSLILDATSSTGYIHGFKWESHTLEIEDDEAPITKAKLPSDFKSLLLKLTVVDDELTVSTDQVVVQN